MPALMTAKGQLVRQFLLQPDERLTNQGIVQKVVQHFPNETFDRKKLTQFVANIRYEIRTQQRIATGNLDE